MYKYDVIIATYNGEKYLDEQVNSILSQTVKPHRVFIRDDCSTDRTVDILERLKRNSSVVIIPSNDNVGYIKNFGILSEYTESDIVFFSDQDDVWMPNKAEKILNVFQKSEKTCAVFSNAKITNENLEQRCQLFDLNGFSSRDLTLKQICSRNFVTGATLAVRKDFLQSNLPFSSDVPHDYYLGFSALLVNGLAYVDESLIQYRQHSSNVIGVKSNTLLTKIKNSIHIAPGWAKQINYINVLSKLCSSYLSQDFVKFSNDRNNLNNKNIATGLIWMLCNINGYRKYVKLKDVVKDLMLLL